MRELYYLLLTQTFHVWLPSPCTFGAKKRFSNSFSDIYSD